MKLNTEGVVFVKNNEFVKDGVKYDLLDFPCGEGFVQPAFDYSQLKWVEGATEKDFLQSAIRFYNTELELASKANVELVCGIITEDVFKEVKTYMKSIDPYAGIKTIPEVKRPEIFKKYL